MLTWKEIKAFVENGHPAHRIADSDRLSYVIVHMDEIFFGVVGQDGFAAAQHQVRHRLGEFQRQDTTSPPVAPSKTTPAQT